MRLEGLKVPGIVLAGACALGTILVVTKNNNDQAAAKTNILSNKTLTTEQYNNYSQRVANGETNWKKLNDSIEATKPAKIQKVKAEIVKDPTVTPQKFYNFEQRAQKDLKKWVQINDSLKARQMINLSKKTTDTIKTVMAHR